MGDILVKFVCFIDEHVGVFVQFTRSCLVAEDVAPREDDKLQALKLELLEYEDTFW